ncbi:MAG: hypothetical protein WC802_03575 [Patescibacteria group bacterium]|jgi:hypothetical protein
MENILVALLLFAYGFVLLMPVYALSDYLKRRAEKTLGFKLKTFGRSYLVWAPESYKVNASQRHAAWKLNLKYLAITVPALFVWLVISLYGFSWVIFKIFGP